jgi:hypothetical protein
MGRPVIEGENPVSGMYSSSSGILSRAGSETPRSNLAAPSAKAKYSQKTDSEQVP